MSFDQIDGVFGAVTRNAVIAFQQSEGLVADGVIGDDTWKHMPADPGTPLLRRGGAGSAVSGLQKGLLRFGGAGAPTDPGVADGVFGPRTEAAVKV
jgi:peptidoglycan hydrolase-like protein with peptidoglycan-binding domain